MTIDHPLRRFLARVCSAETMTRVVDPILADIRWEDGRVTLRGCVSLARALALHAVMSAPGWCAAMWTDDDYAMSKVAGLVLIVATLGSIPLTAPPLLSVRRMPSSLSTMLFMLAPQALALTLPSALVLAIPFAFRRLRLNARLLRRTLLLSVAIAAVTFGIIGWVMPESNQRFREATYVANGGRHMPLDRGPNETPWAPLRRQIQDIRLVRGGESAAAQLEFTYQTRMAIAAAALPLGLASLAVCAVAFGRRRPLLTGFCVLIVYWALMMFEQRQAAISIRAGDFVGVYLSVWTPNAIFLVASAAILHVRRPHPSRVAA